MPPKQRSVFPRLVASQPQPAAKLARARRAPPAHGRIYVVKVTLVGSKPPIWRRIAVPGVITLAELHHVLQIVMGWEDEHLHMFTGSDQRRYGPPTDDGDWDLDDDQQDEAKARLSDLLLQPKDRCLYEYDFGDGWEHGLALEKVIDPESGVRYPACLAGKRACPPEDCGGIWGYAELLDALADPKHAEHEEVAEWIGGEFDAEAFDLDEINAVLRRLQK